MTLTTIGYGDVTPNTTLEYAIATVIMLLGAATWCVALREQHGAFKDVMRRLPPFQEQLADLGVRATAPTLTHRPAHAPRARSCAPLL